MTEIQRQCAVDQEEAELAVIQNRIRRCCLHLLVSTLGFIASAICLAYLLSKLAKFFP